MSARSMSLVLRGEEVCSRKSIGREQQKRYDHHNNASRQQEQAAVIHTDSYNKKCEWCQSEIFPEEET